jgi:hypothetical protein
VSRCNRDSESIQHSTRDGDVGFDSLRDTLEALDPIEQASSEELGEKVEEIVIDRRTGLAASDIDFHWGEEYVEARYERDGDYDEADFYDTGEVYRNIREIVEAKATKVRVTGLSLLAGGFTLQFIATLV